MADLKPSDFRVIFDNIGPENKKSAAPHAPWHIQYIGRDRSSYVGIKPGTETLRLSALPPDSLHFTSEEQAMIRLSQALENSELSDDPLA